MSDALAGLAKLGGGALADDPDRRRSVAVGGYAATAVLSAAIGAATATWHVALLRAGAWTARGLRGPARNALLADAVPAEAYGRAYGFERAMDNLGAILGPLAAVALVATVGTRWAIGVSVVPGLLATVAVIYAIRHTTTTAGTERLRAPLRIRVRPVLSGIAELGCATLVANRSTRRMGSTLTAILFVAVFPANVQMAVDWRHRSGLDPLIAYGRLPLQVPLVVWALHVRRTASMPHSRPARHHPA